MIHQAPLQHVARCYSFDSRVYDRAARKRQAIGLGIGLGLDFSTPSSAVDYSTLNLAGTVPASDILLASQSDVGVTSSGGLLSNWTDVATSPHDFTAALTRRPTLTAGLNGNPGILCNGTTNGLVSSLVLPAPLTTPYRICLVFRQITWISGGYVVGNENSVASILYSSASTPQLRMYNGAVGGSAVGAPALGTWELLQAYFTGSVADSFKRGSGAAVTGINTGNGTGAGFTLGTGGVYAFPTNIEVVHIMILKGASAAALPAAYLAGIAAKYDGLVQQ